MSAGDQAAVRVPFVAVRDGESESAGLENPAP
jgi:hypothetical protein